MIDDIKALAKEIFPELVSFRRHLHANPELSFEERNTAKFIESTLQSFGLETSRVADTGVVAVIEGRAPGKVIALRADLDALPIQELNDVPYCSTNDGVMHACGHDVHTTSLIGTAKILNQLKGQFEGTIKLIFQPGEEKLPGGASLMIKEGVLENPQPEAIFGQHVFPDLEVGKVGFRPGSYMASADEIHITVRGKGGHAAMPHKNIDPILIASHLRIALSEIVDKRVNKDLPSILAIGSFVANGATNVIPSEVHLKGTFRAFDEDWRMKAHEMIRRVSEEVVTSMGGTVEVDVRKGYPSVFNDPSLTNSAKDAAQEYLGKEHVVELEMRPTGEDFSYYTQEMPGSFYRLGTRNEEKGIIHPVHTPHFDVDEACLEVGSGLMAWLAIKELER